jgi:hypothetical protein
MQPALCRCGRLLSWTMKSVLFTAPAVHAEGRHNGWMTALLDWPLVQLLAVLGHRRLAGMDRWLNRSVTAAGVRCVKWILDTHWLVWTHV